MKHLSVSCAALFLLLGACGKSSGGGADNSVCGKAAKPLAGIVLLEVKDPGNDPKILDTFESELTAECKATKAEETAKDALVCYDTNHSKMGYRIFKECPEEPGKSLIATVVAKHGAK